MNYSALDLHALLDSLADETRLYTSIMKASGDKYTLAVHKRKITLIIEELEKRKSKLPGSYKWSPSHPDSGDSTHNDHRSIAGNIS
jgi:hypothetical protein